MEQEIQKIIDNFGGATDVNEKNALKHLRAALTFLQHKRYLEEKKKNSDEKTRK